MSCHFYQCLQLFCDCRLYVYNLRGTYSIVWSPLLFLQGLSVETPTLAGLAPCTRPPTRQTAAPRWGRWGGRRGWCCSAAGAWVCTWLGAAPQCSFWERHIHGARVRNGYDSQKRAAPNYTSGFTALAALGSCLVSLRGYMFRFI